MDADLTIRPDSDGISDDNHWYDIWQGEDIRATVWAHRPTDADDHRLALLFAAAPQLLAACEAAAAFWADTDSSTGALCRAAVAKARGEG